MKLQDFGIGYIDFLIVAMLIVGVVRGRKRGMSEELLDVLKWILIVATGSFIYEPVGSVLSNSTMFSHLASFLTIYMVVVVFYLTVFAFIRRHIGGKIVGSDVFGGAEYYLGMCAGVVRYACVLLVVMAFLHARYYPPEEVRAQVKYQEDNYGTIFFPTLCSMQHEVFSQSLAGRLTQDYLGILLIRPTPPEEKGLGTASLIKARERNVYEVLDKH